MPLTTLANTAIDGVSSRELAVRADIVKYAGSDLLCYRAQQPEALVRRQSEAWDGILDWAAEELGVRFAVGKGLMPIPQPAAAPVAVASALAPLGPFSLAAMHVITALSGSALLALAHLRGRLTAEGLWAAAHVDEFFQISQWGNDAEADARRQRQWAELEAASRMLKLLGS
jgi:chaperone required for assembly of F1-ATPase